MDAHAPTLADTDFSEVTNAERKHDEFWFPGRWVGGTSMILGPLLLLAGVLLRIEFHFFFPEQLAAFEARPSLIFTSYSLFLAGNILMWPAVVTLARLIGTMRPNWAMWGGTFVMFGLFARTFHAGVDHLAFQLVRVQDLERATEAIASSYGAFHIVSSFTPAIVFGWVVLGIGAYLSGTLGLLRSLSFALMASLMIGVLKGSTLVSVVATLGLCIALVPLGIRVLREGPTPRPSTIIGWLLLVVVLVGLFFILGRMG